MPAASRKGPQQAFAEVYAAHPLLTIAAYMGIYIAAAVKAKVAIITPTLAEASEAAAGEWKKAHVPARLLRWVERYHAWRRR